MAEIWAPLTHTRSIKPLTGDLHKLGEGGRAGGKSVDNGQVNALKCLEKKKI